MRDRISYERGREPCPFYVYNPQRAVLSKETRTPWKPFPLVGSPEDRSHRRDKKQKRTRSLSKVYSSSEDEQISSGKWKDEMECCTAVCCPFSLSALSFFLDIIARSPRECLAPSWHYLFLFPFNFPPPVNCGSTLGFLSPDSWPTTSRLNLMSWHW